MNKNTTLAATVLVAMGVSGSVAANPAPSLVTALDLPMPGTVEYEAAIGAPELESYQVAKKATKKKATKKKAKRK